MKRKIGKTRLLGSEIATDPWGNRYIKDTHAYYDQYNNFLGNEQPETCEECFTIDNLKKCVSRGRSATRCVDCLLGKTPS